jgi:intein-encoded DNA endonuclease-like protein
MNKGISIDRIISLFNDGKTPTEISEILGCCVSNITRRLKKAGLVVVRDYSKTRHNRAGRTSIDIDFFKSIDTEEKAYFLGIMFSDGSVSKNQFYLKLNDEDVVIKFKEALKCEYPIRHNEVPYYNYVLEVSCQEMCNDLIKLGCVPNKTKVLEFPDMNDNLKRHFIRGFMDGDGCIRVGSTLGKCMFDIASASYNFIVQLKDTLQPHTTHIGISKETSYDVWHLRCAGKQVKTLLDWLYQDSSVYMKRKYFKYQLISSL